MLPFFQNKARKNSPHLITCSVLPFKLVNVKHGACLIPSCYLITWRRCAALASLHASTLLALHSSPASMCSKNLWVRDTHPCTPACRVSLLICNGCSSGEGQCLPHKAHDLCIDISSSVALSSLSAMLVRKGDHPHGLKHHESKEAGFHHDGEHA